ncbi:hypothetical protein ACFL04_00995 [Patescibacteria group bacterium]
MEDEKPTPEEIVTSDGGEHYIGVEAQVMEKMIADLGIKAEEFLDRYAKEMSDVIKNDPGIAQAIVDDDETVVDKIIKALTEPKKGK